MMEETYLMDHIKEQLCFVSQNVTKDLAASKGRKSIHRRVYVLPDGVTSRLGHVLDEEAGEKPPQQKEMVSNDMSLCFGCLTMFIVIIHVHEQQAGPDGE